MLPSFDYAICGNGLASVLAANDLLLQKKSVIFLNPDPDFFLAHSDLPFSLPSFQPSSWDWLSKPKALEALRLNFPGAVQWAEEQHKGFQDVGAPHVRSRGFIQLFQNETPPTPPLGAVHLESSSSIARFPLPLNPELSLSGFYTSKFLDFDAKRYRKGLLEFVRERLDDALFTGISDFNCEQPELHFYQGKKSYWCTIKKKIFFFWTPTMNLLLQNCLKKQIDETNFIPVELWSLRLPEPLSNPTVGAMKNMSFWIHLEGQATQSQMLWVLVQADQHRYPGESLPHVMTFFRDLLGWKTLTITSFERFEVFKNKQWHQQDFQIGGKALSIISMGDGPSIEMIEKIHHMTQAETVS